MSHLTGAGNHDPPSCTRVPISQAQRLSLRQGEAFSCVQKGAPGKYDREALPPSLGTFPIPGRVVKGRYDPSLLRSTIPVAWFALRAPSGLSGSALRTPEFPRVQGRWYSPRAPLGQQLAPPSPSSHAEGADSYGPGAWRLGAVPGAACAPGPTPSCGSAGFPLRQVRERLKGLGPRGPVWTAPPAGTLPPSIPAVWTHFTVRCSGPT